jgi:hypothetical protein
MSGSRLVRAHRPARGGGADAATRYALIDLDEPKPAG